MKNILIIDDSENDIKMIKDTLAPLSAKQECNLFASNNPADYPRYDALTNHQVDLLILDLEFTNSNISSITYVDDFPYDVPIIIVIHLQHYQHLLQSKLNVKGFVPKSVVKERLLPLAESVLFDQRSSASEEVFQFPSSGNTVPFVKKTSQIRFLELIKRGVYCIHLTDGNTLEIPSGSFRKLVHALDKQYIKNLHPVCRGEVINVNYIKSIKRDDDGRIEIYLINLPTHPFHVGKQYESYYIPFLPYSRRRENNKENRDDIPV